MTSSSPVVIESGMARETTPPLDRLMRNVSYDHGCWTLTRMVGPLGYGLVGVAGSGTKLAHRISYESLVGCIPSGMDLDHLCRNRACINPLHLEPVSRRENAMRGAGPQSRSKAQLDALAAGRRKAHTVGAATRKSKTHCKRGHEFTPENTSVLATGSRLCIACNRARAKAWAAAKKDATG